jgi:hypothetical protein
MSTGTGRTGTTATDTDFLRLPAIGTGLASELG